MSVESMIAAAWAAAMTWEAAVCIIFWREWREERLKYLRERFGRDSLSELLNERAVFGHHLRMVAWWIFLATLAWAWLIDALRRVE